ncbi:FecR domain-containing protein [Pedobacter sp. N36a]|uniref:FecR family protein n=1 Tax=Pedobacter sp. N36a TaxID=2767996 RepID=UPI001656FA07|nr:FecR domain-containing protein [Pedobacter sp. N36a]MBC8984215.1 FecR domain-containing protein [Pedobacter sp. N36a]
MTKEEQAQLLLSKYLNGEASPQEREQVEHWYQSYEFQTPLPKGKKSEIAAAVLLNLQEEMARKDAKSYRLFGTYRLAKIAAVLFFVLAVGIGYWSVQKTEVVKERFVTLHTTASEKKIIVFSDGSQVIMAPLAQLVYPLKFKSKDRTISLTEGEAFFEVAHEENRPFLVKTSNDLYTKVLGTSFRIQSYKNRPHISIQVATGKVAVGNTHQVFGTLAKGQELSYDKVHQRAEIKDTPVKLLVDLKFENIAMEDLIPKLEYAYNIHISLGSPSLGKLKCTGVFNTRQSPEEILEIICALHQLKFSASENHKTFNVYRK